MSRRFRTLCKLSPSAQKKKSLYFSAIVGILISNSSVFAMNPDPVKEERCAEIAMDAADAEGGSAQLQQSVMNAAYESCMAR